MSPSLSRADHARLARAFEYAERSQHRCRVGAVIWGGGRFLGGAANIAKNDARITADGASVHAEDGASRQTRVKGATVYVARMTKAGAPAMARPCAYCVTLLAARGVERAVWTAGGNAIGIARLKELLHECNG